MSDWGTKAFAAKPLTKKQQCLIAAAPDLLEALTAIRARISGEWDNPALLKFGPLSDTETDIQIIAQTAIAKAEGRS